MMPIPHSGQIMRSSQVNGLEISALNEPTFVYEVGELSESGLSDIVEWTSLN